MNIFRRRFGGFFLLAALIGVLFVGAGCWSMTNSSQTAVIVQTPQLITEPTDGFVPIVSAIQTATQSLDLVIYELHDASVEQALVAASQRKVRVRVLLCAGSLAEANESAYLYLRSAGVAVQWAPISFTFTHQKTLVVDGREAFIMTFNLVTKDEPTGRDFAVVDQNVADLHAIEHVFEADWDGREIYPSNGTDLVWSPGAEPALLHVINSANASIEIYNEEMNDDTITDALVDAARRGVSVEIVMTDNPAYHAAFQKLADAGVGVRLFAPKATLYIHAKLILVDKACAFLGSQNFSYTSLYKNRELGLMVTNPSIISSLHQTFQTDWVKAIPFHAMTY